MVPATKTLPLGSTAVACTFASPLKLLCQRSFPEESSFARKGALPGPWATGNDWVPTVMKPRADPATTTSFDESVATAAP